MSDKEASTNDEIVRAVEFEQKRCILINGSKDHRASRLPKIHLIRLQLRQICKPFVVCNSHIEPHMDHAFGFCCKRFTRQIPQNSKLICEKQALQHVVQVNAEGLLNSMIQQ